MSGEVVRGLKMAQISRSKSALQRCQKSVEKKMAFILANI
jgi:hypothetical protein